MNKPKNQTSLGVKRRVKKMFTLIANKERRPISTQLEIIAEQECQRLGIPIPKTNETEKEAL